MATLIWTIENESVCQGRLGILDFLLKAKQMLCGEAKVS